MQVETVQAEPQPMLFLTRPAKMDPAEIGKLMAQAFQTLGAFIAAKQVAMAGAPLAVYRDYKDDGSLTVDIGFPVPRSELAKASGEVKAGETPSGRAIKTVHRGPYERLHETYKALDRHLKKEGIEMPPMAWEVYVSDPDKTPPGDLLTEIYMPLP